MKKNDKIMLAGFVILLVALGWFFNLLPFSFISAPIYMQWNQPVTFIMSFDPKAIASHGVNTTPFSKCSELTGILELGYGYSKDAFAVTALQTIPVSKGMMYDSALNYCRLNVVANMPLVASRLTAALKTEVGKNPVYFQGRLCSISGCSVGSIPKYLNSGVSTGVQIVGTPTTTTLLPSQTTTTIGATTTTLEGVTAYIDPTTPDELLGKTTSTESGGSGNGGTHGGVVCKNTILPKMKEICDYDDTTLIIAGIIAAMVLVGGAMYLRR